MLTGQVFVSHTAEMAAFPVGRSFVRAAVEGIVRAGMAPVDMGFFAARDGQPADYCRERVRQCEVYLALIGFRYGSIVPGEAISYTELEFTEAAAAGLPRLVFLLDENADAPADADRGAVDGFRERLREAGLIAGGFAAPDGLELAVYQALMERELAGGRLSRAGVRFSLPPDAAAFTGRGEELKQIMAAATDAVGRGEAVTVQAIGGMPGVGKTALAIHAAHLLRHIFRDRQLFIDMHSYAPGREPVRPEDALVELLTATGVDLRFVPEGLDGRIGMWRDRMAGQRALLVIDNAASSSQVIPLLPGGEGCLVLITSRRHLADLPGLAAPVMLDALPTRQAAEMFSRLARRATDQAGVMEVVRLAGSLPLAISLLARVFARHPSWTLADLAAETREGLLTLTAENDSIAAAFEVSYEHLEPAARRLFCLLGLTPGTTTDAYSAAALAGVSPGKAAELLDGLHAEALLTETGYRRYGMHDLLRRYACDHADAYPDDERQRALGRLLRYYQDTAARAQALLARQSRPGASPVARRVLNSAPELDDGRQALAWVRANRDDLLACLDQATRSGQHSRVTAMTASLAELLQRDGPWTEAVTRHVTAVQAAQHLGDRLGEAYALIDLGEVRRLTGDYSRAASDLERALTLCRDLGDRAGQATALTCLGIVRQRTGDYRSAARDLQRALASYRDLGDRLGQATALTRLGELRRLTSDYTSAACDLEQALTLSRDLGDRLGQATALTRLGDVRQLTGDYTSAARDLEQALTLCRDLGDRLGQATALTCLGELRRLSSDYTSAACDLEQALTLSRDLGDRLGQATALTCLGIVRQRTGKYPQAARDLEQALTLCRDLGNRLGQASALTWLGILAQRTGTYPEAARDLERALSHYRSLSHRLGQATAHTHLGDVRRLTGDYPNAARDLDRALALYRALGERGGLAEALNYRGALHRAMGEQSQAEKCHQQALKLARAIPSAWDEANALAGLGRSATAGQYSQAEDLLQQALDIFERIGAVDAYSVLAELTALKSSTTKAVGSSQAAEGGKAEPC